MTALRSRALRYDAWMSALMPSIVLPSQWTPVQAVPATQGVRKLQVAVLTDAIEVLVGRNYRLGSSLTTNQKRALRAETQAWFASDGMRHPFTFARICEYLGLDRARVREAVLDHLATSALLLRRRLHSVRGHTRAQLQPMLPHRAGFGRRRIGPRRHLGLVHA